MSEQEVRGRRLHRRQENRASFHRLLALLPKVEAAAAWEIRPDLPEHPAEVPEREDQRVGAHRFPEAPERTDRALPAEPVRMNRIMWRLPAVAAVRAVRGLTAFFRARRILVVAVMA